MGHIDGNNLLRNAAAKCPCLASCAITAYKLCRQCREVIWSNSVLRNITGLKLDIIRVEGYRNTFVGYYDVAPFRPGDASTLALHCNSLSSNRYPSMGHRTDIVLYDRKARTHRILDSTHTWNWQQGSRLQWVDRDHIIYNHYDSNKGKVLAVLRSIVDGDAVVLPVNLNALYRNEFVLSIDYYALSQYAEYGYPGLPQTGADSVIQRYSLQTGAVDAMFAIEDVQKSVGHRRAKRGHINHILVAPDGEHFVFIYRFYDWGRRIDSLLLYSFRGGRVSPLVSEQIVSHCAWRDADTILFWGIVDATPGFYLLDIGSALLKLMVPSRHDAHPVFLDDHTILGDSYPSLCTGLHSLFVMDLEPKQRRDLLTLSHPVVWDKACRCDMHPSVSRDADCFQIDTRYGGDRSVIIGAMPDVRL